MINEVGNRYGKLTVLKLADIKAKGRNSRKNAYWLCQCDCGLTTVTSGTYLRNGHTTSCGCVKRQYIRTTHGRSDSERLYGVWEQMRSRCNNPNNPRYKTYGANGVKVCDEWSDYGKFREWSYSHGYEERDCARGNRMSIDRIDPNKDYCPGNCRWITLSDNIRHRFECHANQR